MAYDSETNKDLITNIGKSLNTAENAMQAAMRRSDELNRRLGITITPTPPPPTVTPPPPPPPAASGWVKTEDIKPVPRDFDVNAFLRPAGQGHIVPVGELSAMRISQPHVAISRVDPFFRVAEGDHTHDLFNRSNIPASGEYADLIKSNNASGEGGLINATFYALGSLMVQDMDDRWHNLIARMSIFYYKHDRQANPIFKNPLMHRADLPRGLKLLGGIRHYRDQAAWSKVSNDPKWNCPINYRILQGDVGNPSDVPGAPTRCQNLDELLPFVGTGIRHIQSNVGFPRFWNPAYVDSPNHTEHAQYFPSETHNHVLPDLSTHAVYTLPSFPIKRIATSADIDTDGRIKDYPGRETHGYWWEGFVDSIRETFHRSVFDTGRDGSNGNLQNGQALSWMPSRSVKPLSILLPDKKEFII